MRIDQITLHMLSMPLKSHFETSFGRIFSRDCVLIEIASQGLTGWGECVADHDPGYSYETTTTAWHILKDFIIPKVLGKNYAQPGDVQKDMDFVRGHPMAKGGIEMALWDILGQQEGKSLRQLFGGVHSQVNVGVSVGLQDSPSELVERVGAYLSQGYGRIKIKIKPGRDVGDAQAVRLAFPQILLQVDANSAYTLETAGVLTPLDDLNLLLIEQPLAEDDIWDHSRLQPKLKTAICLDESIHSVRHARYALEMNACRIINIKAGRVGGLSEARAIHDLCYSHKMPVWCGGMLETGVGRAANLALASLPGFSLPGDISATDRYYAEDVTNEQFTLNNDSTIDVPQKPGLGVSVNRAALQRARQAEYSTR